MQRRLSHGGLDHAELRSLLEELMAAPLTSQFDSLIDSTLMDSFKAAASASFLELMRLAEPSTIRRCASEDRLASCLGIMISEGFDSHIKVKYDALMASTLRLLKDNGNIVPDGAQWPFAAALDMASNFVGMLADRGPDEQATFGNPLVSVFCDPQ